MSEFSELLTKTNEFGEVTAIHYPMVFAKGLANARWEEEVIFESGMRGIIFSLGEKRVEIVLLGQGKVEIGEKIVSKGNQLSIGVGENSLGTIVNPLGEKVLGKSGGGKGKKAMRVEKECLGMMERQKISQPLSTGVALVDLLIPLAKGQKELVIGDKKSGKTAFVLNVCKQQLHEGSVVVYAAIGKGMADIKKLEHFFANEGLTDQTVIVAASASEAPGLIYLAPYTAAAVAEYFKENGRDVLLVLDDLSTHAKYYREIGLLSGRFPGRESYPGDIFFSHARLMERAGNFKHPTKGEVAISCLPIAETVESDLTGYIATNIMSMTDGHIFFDSGLYYQGQRPAVNISLSVTRVGRQVQTPLKKEISQQLLSFLVNYDHVQNYSRFGSEMSEEIKEVIDKGEKIMTLFHQSYWEAVPEAVELVLFGLIWQGCFRTKNNDDIILTKKNLIHQMNDQTVAGELKKYSLSPDFKSFLKLIEVNKKFLLELCTNVK